MLDFIMAPHYKMDALDPSSQSERILALLDENERIRKQRFDNIQTVLVVLSSRGMVYDVEALRHKIRLTYPQSAIFFESTCGKPYGVQSPRKIDLLIDLTGPGQKQGWFRPRALRKSARFAVGRNAGLFGFRKRLYDRVFDETVIPGFLSRDVLLREREAQKKVLEHAGVTLLPLGDPTADRAKEIALELPGMAQT